MKKYKPIKAINVAKAIINISKNNYQIKFFESDKLLEVSMKFYKVCIILKKN